MTCGRSTVIALFTFNLSANLLNAAYPQQANNCCKHSRWDPVGQSVNAKEILNQQTNDSTEHRLRCYSLMCLHMLYIFWKLDILWLRGWIIIQLQASYLANTALAFHFDAIWLAYSY